MKKIIIFTILVALGAFLWWAFSPLLFDKEVQDELDPALQARLEAQKKVDEERARQQAAQQDSDVEETSTPLPAETSTPIEEPQVFTDGPFEIVDTKGHPASGSVRTIHSPEETLIQYQNYDGTNGPDLFVYLAKDLEATEFVNLGRAKGNKGDIIYGVPLDVDLDEYKYVMTWCKAFGVLFDYAEIN